MLSISIVSAPAAHYTGVLYKCICELFAMRDQGMVLHAPEFEAAMIHGLTSMWLVVICIFGAGVIVGGLMATSRPRGGHDKATQSQVTYMRKLAKPRFQPLSDVSHGCFRG